MEIIISGLLKCLLVVSIKPQNTHQSDIDDLTLALKLYRHNFAKM